MYLQAQSRCLQRMSQQAGRVACFESRQVVGEIACLGGAGGAVRVVAFFSGETETADRDVGLPHLGTPQAASRRALIERDQGGCGCK